MRVSYEWLKSMVDVPADPKELVAEFTRTGTEVEAVEKVGANLEHVVTAQVVSKKPHPDSDHMWLCQVSVGDKNVDENGNPVPLQIVCGAQNFNEGDHIVTALIGAELPGGVKNILLRDAKLYIWYDNSSGVYESDIMSASEADEWLRCIDYEELLQLPASAILSTNYELFGGESCICVEYSSGELGYLNRVYVSVSTGLLMGAETYDGDSLIYSMSSSAPSFSAPDESMFRLPSEEEHGAEND